MSEVKRWKLKGFLPGVEGECKAVFQPTVVMAEDFDNATRLFLDAAERCVASERREKELQRRLTAADERADVLERDKARIDWLADQPVDTLYLDDGRIIDIAGRVDLRDAIDAAMASPRPAEVGGDD
ncbi:hypothetical protein CDH05_06870 [Pseudomonas lactis]|uniref:hypothetical protein n=1 Tax=Pseudomonas lactis TaxID=1615674 RepID=UPI000B6E2381|nr:hypothetical protein [Pseudomonas lactis]OWQ42529.1 hypothetical protein CDH05_06870 [Pseudomonas lactis]